MPPTNQAAGGDDVAVLADAHVGKPGIAAAWLALMLEAELIHRLADWHRYIFPENLLVIRGAVHNLCSRTFRGYKGSAVAFERNRVVLGTRQAKFGAGWSRKWPFRSQKMPAAPSRRLAEDCLLSLTACLDPESYNLTSCCAAGSGATNF